MSVCGRNVLFLAAVPFAAFYMMQFLFGGLPWEYTLSVALGNALCVGMIYYPLCALTGRPVFSGLTVEILAGIWGAANYYVAEFRGNPVLPWDFTSLGTGGGGVGNLPVDITWRMALVLAVTVLLEVAVIIGRSGRGFE